MRSYAEKDSTSKTKRRRDDELEGQPDIAESRWFDQAERIGRNGEWNFELADSMPFLISKLPCWKEGGLALHVWNGRYHQSFGESARSAGNVYIEVADGHYWALVSGEKVWVPADGNCFFNAIWKSLQACGDMDAVRRIFRGNLPANEREASDYFRREIRSYAFDHPELEAILLGDADGPTDPRSAPRRPPSLRKAGGQPEGESSQVGDVAGSAEHTQALPGRAERNGSSITTDVPRKGAVVEQDSAVSSVDYLADLIAQDGMWDADAFEAVPYLITRITGWGDDGPALEVEHESGVIQRFGMACSSAVRIRLKNKRYCAVVNGKELPARGGGDSFFYAVWDALMDSQHDAAAERIFNTSEPLTRRQAARFFRDAIRNSLIRNRAPVVETSGVPGDLDETDIDEFFDASDTAEWLVQAGRPAVHAAGPEGGLPTPENSQIPMPGVNHRSILYKRPTLRASEIPRARKTVRWNASLVESIPIPQTGQSEWQRVLFSVGYQVSGWLAQSELRTFGYWALGKISPLASVATSAGMSLYNLVMAWKQGDVPAGLIQALLVLPYQLLSPQSLLFAIAETTKQYIDDTLGLTDPDSLSDDERFQRDTLYLCAGLVALVSYYGFFVQRREVYSKISDLLGIRAKPRNLLLHHNRRRLRIYLGGRGKYRPKEVRFRNAMKSRGSAQGHYAKLPPKGFLLRSDARPLRTFVSGRARAKFTPDEFRFRPKAKPSRISLEQRAKSPLDRIFQQHVVAAVRTVLAERTVFPPNGFLVANNMAAPQTPLGRKLVGMVRVPQYAIQSYAVLQTVVRAQPRDDFHPGREDLLAERMELKPHERATQRQEHRERFNAARAARVRSNTTSLASRDTGLEMQANPTMAAAMPGKGNGLVVGYKRENRTSNAVPGGVCTGVTAHAFFTADKYTSAIANLELPRDPETLTAITRSPGVKSGGYMSVPMAVATGTAAIVVGNAAFSSASGDAVAHTVESAALLIDENAAVVATVGGMRSELWRKPFVIAPLVFAALGLVGAVLYRLYLWVMALWPTDVERHVSQAESTMTTDVTESFVASTEAVGEAWPSSVKLNEMIDDFIVTLTEEDDDFLAMGQSVIPSEDAMPSDLIDLVLYQFEQEDATDRSARSRRSVGADNQPTIAAPVTNELSSWIQSNWPATEAFTPPQNDPMRAVAKGVYESKNGNAYMFIGGAYWKFVSTGRHSGYLENEKTKVKFILLRSIPNFRWYFSRTDRKNLGLGPIPDADIPKPAPVAADLASWVIRNWGATGIDVQPGGGIRFSDGIHEDKNRNLFLKINDVFWKFRFMADQDRAELSNRNGDAISLKLSEGRWNKDSEVGSEAVTTDASRVDSNHIIENLFNYDFYSDPVKNQLKEIVRAALSGVKEIKYSELISRVKEQCDVWFAKEYGKKNSTTVAEILLARDEIEVRVGHLKYYGRSDSCLLAHVHYIRKHPDLYANFLRNYSAWKSNPDGSLLWVFPGQEKGSQFKLKGSEKGEIRHGRIQPLIGKGVLFSKSANDPGIDFNFVRSDAMVDTADLPPQKFTLSEIGDENGRLHGLIGISRGDQANSVSTNGPIMGSWGNRDSLDSNAVVIEISNGMSGTVGINIPLSQLPEGKPFIISAGDLSGCTMAYAVDGNTFYAYHSGQKSGDSNWLTSREGAASLYRAHLSLTGRAVPGYNIADNKLVGEDGAAIAGNDALVNILSIYDKSTINYFGKSMPDGTSTRTTVTKNNVNQFDYNESFESEGSRVGVAYALLVKDKGKVKVTTYSEDMSVFVQKGKTEILTHDNSEFILKNFYENFEERKFEKIAPVDETPVELTSDQKERKSLVESVFYQDKEIKYYVSNPDGNSRNAVKRLWDLFSGGRSSGIVQGFGEGSLSAEDAKKVEDLKNIVREEKFSIKIRAVNYWESDRTSAINRAHFAFMLNFPDIKFILDPTAFSLVKNIAGPLIKLEKAWLNAYQAALVNSTATVKYKDFSSYEEALEFSPAHPVDARTYVEGSFLIREAPWYREDGVPPTGVESPVMQPQNASLAADDEQATRALLRTLLATTPEEVGETQPVRDLARAAGLIHFFSFENGVGDAIAPNVSLRPFDSTSTTTGTFIDDNFGGMALQVSSLNRVGDGLNGMRLSDDVSSRPQFSIGFWFKSDGVQHHAPVLGNKDWGGALNPGFMIDQQNDGLLKFNVADGSKRADVFLKFTRNAWVYVAMAVDTTSSSATAYVGDPIHGVQTATLNLGGMDPTGISGTYSTIALNEDVLGNYYSRYGHTFGSMTFDDLAMWSHALTQRELNALAMSGITGGLIHFFPFEKGPADVVARNVSLHPFDSASTTHASFIADHFGGEAMQVSSQNWLAGALNGMKLADDVSSHPQFSIGFWFKSDGEQNHAPVLGNKDWSAGENPGFVIDQQEDGWLKFNVGDGKKRVDKFIRFKPDAWVYVAMTVDTAASTATAYVVEPSGAGQAVTLDLRGMDMTQLTGNHATIALNEDALGNYYSRRNSGYGTMAFNDLAMWSRVLTRTEVQSLGVWGRSLSELLDD